MGVPVSLRVGAPANGGEETHKRSPKNLGSDQIEGTDFPGPQRLRLSNFASGL